MTVLEGGGLEAGKLMVGGGFEVSIVLDHSIREGEVEDLVRRRCEVEPRRVQDPEVEISRGRRWKTIGAIEMVVQEDGG